MRQNITHILKENQLDTIKTYTTGKLLQQKLYNNGKNNEGNRRT